MKKKTETFYAPFRFKLTDLVAGKEIHNGIDGMVVAMRDQIQAYDTRDKLKKATDDKLSAFGCGPDHSQHVYLPTCTGMVTMEVPVGAIENDKQVVNLSQNPEWIQNVSIDISGDVSHGPLLWSQITFGMAPDYSDLKKQACIRFEDLSRITAKIASLPDAIRERVDMHDEYARDSLNTLYNSSGFMHRRIYQPSNPTPEQSARSWGQEYLQTYMKACEGNLSLDFMLRNAHDWEDAFKEKFDAAYGPGTDYRAISASVVYEMLNNMAQATTDMETRVILTMLMQQADRDATVYSDNPLDAPQDIVDNPVIDEQEEVL